jgi:hypothetical protein
MRKEPRYSLNLNKISWKATQALLQIDDEFVGSKDYMGLTYFWGNAYKHILRPNKKYWVKIHSAMLNAGLNVEEESDQHLEIIRRYIRD